MKLSHTLFICACLVFAGMNFSNAVTPAPVPQQQVQKWEYLSVLVKVQGSFVARESKYGNGDLAPYSFSNAMGKIGDDGWELVSVVGTIGQNATYYFKRPKN